LLLLVFLFPSLPALFFLPTGYVLEGPGSSFDLLEKVEVRGWEVQQGKGELLLTSVLVDEASLAEVFFALLSPDYDVSKASQSPVAEETDLADDLYTCISRMSATVLALREAGVPVEVKRRGAAVMEVVQGMPAAGELKTGDVILEVDGRPTPGVAELKEAVSGLPPGTGVVLTVDELEYEDEEAATFRLADRGREVHLQTAEAGGETVIGVVAADWFDYRSPVEVAWELGPVRGPSAGLMMALTLYDLLTPGDLAGGRKVAGTGTIDLEGRVGPIGGLAMKVKAAERMGAEVFLYPEENHEEAVSLDTGMLLVPVRDFEEAVRALEDGMPILPAMPSQGRAFPACWSPGLGDSPPQRDFLPGSGLPGTFLWGFPVPKGAAGLAYPGIGPPGLTEGLVLGGGRRKEDKRKGAN
jgi:PDZ domain-containing protein